MKKAIITGATGFIGSALVQMLLQEGVEVLALGRKPRSDEKCLRLPRDVGIKYYQLPMQDISFLPRVLNELSWSVGNECVFYNFAWGGIDRLSDLDVKAQMRNVHWTACAVETAHKVGCSRFIHVGTMEEPIAHEYLQLDHRFNSEFNRHVVYSLAKTAARNCVKVLSARLGFDCIIASNSHVMGPGDDKDSFLQETLKKIKYDSDDLIFSTGEQLFDVISLYDCARAYVLIGMKGIPSSEYWIGSGEARELREYVEIMAELYPPKRPLQFGKLPYNDISMRAEDFCIDLLTRDTGYKPKYTYEEAVGELYSSV